MLLGFFDAVRAGGIKASPTELLTLIAALKAGVAQLSMDEFYHLSRATLVKSESQYDRFDKAFAGYFRNVEDALGALDVDLSKIPKEWLEQMLKRELTDEEKAKLQGLGGLDKLMQALAERLAEQKEAHHGGNKWIGTGGTSPFGHGGTNPEGVRIGGKGGGKSAVKVWEKREYKDLDSDLTLGIRNIQVALRRLRRFARQGSPDTLDLDGTIHGTAANAGWLDLHMVPERRNTVKVLLFLDVGGSMDPHVRVCEELFSAARTEFKRLEHFYFHNFVYESVWKSNVRRAGERTNLMDIVHKYGPDHKVIFVGDASMSPYEIASPGGSVEHWNEEAGEVWFRRLREHFPHVVWLNPEAETYWGHTASTALVQDLLGEGRMFPMTLDGLERGMKRLVAR